MLLCKLNVFYHKLIQRVAKLILVFDLLPNGIANHANNLSQGNSKISCSDIVWLNGC